MHDVIRATTVLFGLALLSACAQDGREAGAPADTVRVTLRASTIQIPDTLSAGPTTFEVTNRDTVEHGFRVQEVVAEGLPPNLAPDRIVEELGSGLAPGRTGTVSVDLRPGRFEAYCPLPGHDGREARAELAVTTGSP